MVAVSGLPSGEAILAIQSHGVSALDSMGGGRSFCPIPSYIGLQLLCRKLWFVGKRSRFLTLSWCPLPRRVSHGVCTTRSAERMMHTTSVGPEVSLHSSTSDKFHCSWTSMKLHVGPGAPSTKTPWGEEYLISPVLCRSLQLCIGRQLGSWDWRWHCSRGVSPTNALGVAVISAGPKCEGASCGKSPQDLGWRLLLCQRSLLFFQLRRPLELPAQDQLGTLCNLQLSGTRSEGSQPPL